MYLQVRPQVSIVHTDIYPDINAQKTFASKNIHEKPKKKTKATAILTLKANGKSIQQEIVLLPGENKTETILSLGDNICLWDEFNPNLYTLEASLTDKEKINYRYSYRAVRYARFQSNRPPHHHQRTSRLSTRNTGLCSFSQNPATHLPTKLHGKMIFTACRNHGLNHIRFHSWCPPEAAFCAADKWECIWK